MDCKGQGKVAIVALLVVIIVAGYFIFRQTSCLNDMKQLALTMHMYASDYGGYATTGYRLGAGGSNYVNGIFAARGYIMPQTNSVYYCPSNPKGRRLSHGYNSRYYGRDGSVHTYRLVDGMRQPSAMVMWFDCDDDTTNSYVSFWGYPGLPQFYGNPAFHHNGIMTASFADGHAEALTRSQYADVAGSYPPHTGNASRTFWSGE